MAGNRVFRALGLMSGTSADGIDAALIETDGESLVRPGPAMARPYGPELATLLRAAMAEARACRRRDKEKGALSRASAA